MPSRMRSRDRVTRSLLPLAFLAMASPRVVAQTATQRPAPLDVVIVGGRVLDPETNLDAARTRVKEMGIRVVWQADLDDISGTHLHPADMRGAIVSLDRADPPESWRWGGPAWIGSAGEGAPGHVVGAAIDVTDPNSVALRWGSVLRVEPIDRMLDLDGGSVVFNPCADERDEGLTGIAVAVPDDIRRDRKSVEIGGVEFALFG